MVDGCFYVGLLYVVGSKGGKFIDKMVWDKLLVLSCLYHSIWE